MSIRKRLGYWISERKAKKLALPDVLDELTALNIEVVKIDLSSPLTEQGPFDIILHKLTDLIIQADQGNKEAKALITNVENYLRHHPQTIMIDPINCLRTVIDRNKTYTIIHDFLTSDKVFVPPFVVLDSNNQDKNIALLRNSKVTFPLVCKPIIAHGSSSAHEVRLMNDVKSCNLHVMTLVFNEDGLAESCSFPCVVQSFVNHNAILYKCFVLGDEYVLVERPSIRNLTASKDMKPIHFHSGDVSKPSSSNKLTFQEDEGTLGGNIPSQDILDRIVKDIRKVLRLGLFGVDVVVDASSGRHAIIDVNSFPGYGGLKNFPAQLASFIRSELDKETDGMKDGIDGQSNFKFPSNDTRIEHDTKHS